MEGMDEPLFIPERNIDVDGSTPTNVADLRPGSNNPFVVNQNTVTITFTYTTPAKTDTVKLTTSENVESFTVKYTEPGSNTPVTVVTVSNSVVYMQDLFVHLMRSVT